MDGDREMPARLTQEEIRFLLGAVEYDPLLAGGGKTVVPEKDAPDALEPVPGDSAAVRADSRRTRRARPQR
ncbi:MAG: hypothetical protein DBY37_02700 [Desulfovibrionaceae bacterium]|nr:MAG: hypothetical protein DBY37_02700 [Desulfovibrionaceae bacterium]